MRPGKRGQSGEALGRSQGGFSTKIHILVDALGNPVEFVLTAGQEADVSQAEPLMQGHQAGAFIADKAYDSDAVVATAKRQGADAVIPPKKNRKVSRDYDKHLYKDARRSSGSSTCSSSTGGSPRGTRRRPATSSGLFIWHQS